MGKVIFLKAFFKNWKEVGSIIPSSGYLSKKICEAVDFNKAKTIIELGPGTGSVTLHILKSLRPDAKLIVFETNKDFCAKLREIRDARLVVCNVSGLEMSKVLKEKADYVISGVPLAMLSQSSLSSLLSVVKEVLLDGGLYVQFQYSLSSHKTLKQSFGTVKIGFTLLNTPPAFVYSCSNSPN